MIRSRASLRLAFLLGASTIAGPSWARAQDAAKPAADAAAEAKKLAAEANRARGEVQKAELEAQKAELEARKAESDARKAQTKARLAEMKAKAAADRDKAAADRDKESAGRERRVRDLTARVHAVQAQPSFRTARVAAADPISLKIGVTLAPADEVLRSQLGLNDGRGVVVRLVKEGSPAAKAGVKANDVVVEIGDKPAKGVDEVRATIVKLDDAKVQLKLIREGKPTELTLTGIDKATSAASGPFFIGVPVAPVDATLRAHVPGLAEGVGLVALDVVANSPAAKAGVKKFDVLKKLGETPLKDQASLVAAIQATEGKQTLLDVTRAGVEIGIFITPVRRDPSQVAQTSGEADKWQTQAFQGWIKAAGPEMWTVMDPKFDVKTFTDEQVAGAMATVKEQVGKVLDPAATEAILKEVEQAVKEATKEIAGDIEEARKDLREAIDDLKKKAEAEAKKPEGE